MTPPRWTNFEGSQTLLRKETVLADFNEFHAAQARHHDSVLHGSGVAHGLKVSTAPGAAGVLVDPGVAITPRGDLIILADQGTGQVGVSEPLTESAAPVLVPTAGLAPGRVVLTIQHSRVRRLVPPNPGQVDLFPDGKWEVSPWLRLRAETDLIPEQLEGCVVLAHVEVNGAGQVANVTSQGRRLVSSRLGALAFQRPAGTGTVTDEIVARIRATSTGIALTATTVDIVGEINSGKINDRDISADGATLDGLVQQVNQLKATVQEIQKSLVPIGTIVPYGKATPPTGWLLCDGSTKTIAQFPALAAVLGTTFGGNGSTTFGVPNLQRRFPRGSHSSQPAGATGGSDTQQLSASNVPPHKHKGRTKDANKLPGIRVVHAAGSNILPNHVTGWTGGAHNDVGSTEMPAAAHTHDFETNSGEGLNGAEFSITPPFISLTFIIKAI